MLIIHYYKWFDSLKNKKSILLGSRTNSTYALFSSQKDLKNFAQYLSHRIFRRMHGALNICKKNN
jgi:hypothetical protein